MNASTGLPTSNADINSTFVIIRRGPIVTGKQLRKDGWSILVRNCYVHSARLLLPVVNLSPVYICQKTLVCLGCGYTELVVPATESKELQEGNGRIAFTGCVAQLIVRSCSDCFTRQKYLLAHFGNKISRLAVQDCDMMIRRLNFCSGMASLV